MSGTVAHDAMDIVDPALSARLDEAASRYGTLEGLAADPAQAKDQRAYRELMQEYAQLAAVVRERDQIRSLAAQIEETEELGRRGGGRGDAGARGRGGPRPQAEPGRVGRTRSRAAGAARPQRIPQHHHGDPRGYRRRRGDAVHRRPVPDVQPLRGRQALEGGDHLLQRDGDRRFPRAVVLGRRHRRVRPSALGERRAPRAARAGDRVARPHPHLGRDRGGAPGGTGDRGGNPRGGCPCGRLPLLGPGAGKV